MTRQRTVALVGAVTVTILTVLRSAGHHHHSAVTQGVLPAAANTAAASTVAVQLVHALADDDPRLAATTITATATVPLARSLLEARTRARTTGAPRADLTVTSAGIHLDGSHADVRVAGQLTTNSSRVAVAWTLRLVANPDGGWRVEAVS